MGRNFNALLNGHSAVVAMVQVGNQDLGDALEIAKRQGVALVVVVVAERAAHVLAQVPNCQLGRRRQRFSAKG
jgi:hypothetical protein